MTLSLYIGARLIFSSHWREEILTKLAFFKERDEREVFLSGRATKTTFLTSLAILICLLCLSVFQVSLYQVPPEKAVRGKSRTIALGLDLSLMEKERAKPPREQDAKDVFKSYISYTGLPVSKTAILLFLIFWQIASYNYSIRKSELP